MLSTFEPPCFVYELSASPLRPGIPFLVAASGPIKVHQLLAGHFRVVMNRKLQTTVQTLDSVSVDKEGATKTVTLHGTLIKEDAKPDLFMAKLGDIRAAWSELTAHRQMFKAEAKLKVGQCRLTTATA